MLKKWMAAVMAGAMALGLASMVPTQVKAAEGEVYYLNFKPEADEAWQNLAKAYTEETGVKVTVVTAASNQYEQTLLSEISKDRPPTLFHVNGPIGLENWADYCKDLKETDLYKELISEDYALKQGDEVKAVAMAVESYGLIVNKTLLKQAGYEVGDIKSFEDLKKVAEDITKRKDELGFAAFSSAGMDGSSNWRFQTHLANLPVYFEYKDDQVSSKTEIKGTYLPQYKAMLDLYFNNSTVEPKLLASKTGDDSRNEFLAKEAVFFQNGSWEFNNLVGEGKLNADELQMIPLYIGVGDESKQGLCTGTENFWCVNQEASEADVQATLDFVKWCVTSEKGTKAMSEDMGFVIPFKNAQPSQNLFVQQDRAYTEEGKVSVSWAFTTMPSQTWKDNLASALTAYAAGTADWSEVEKAFVEGWKTEYELKG